MKVQDPTGRTWRVRRRWLPWRRRSRVPDWMDGWGFPTGAGDDPISLLLGLLALIVVIPLLIVAVLISLELLLLVLLLPIVLLARIVFGHAWVVEVRQGWSLHWSEPSGNWSESGQRMRSIATLIQRGELPPRKV